MRLPRPHHRPPQTCSLRISKQLVEKVLLMRIFHLCSVRVFRAEISDETQSMRSEKLFIKRSKQYTFWHNITTTSPTLDQKTNQTPALLLLCIFSSCVCHKNLFVWTKLPTESHTRWWNLLQHNTSSSPEPSTCCHPGVWWDTWWQ